MATLQANKQHSASTAQARLKQASRDRQPQPIFSPKLVGGGEAVQALPGPAPIPLSTPAQPKVEAKPDGRLTEIEQRQLLLQTATVYPGWHLASMQHRPENDVLIAHLVRSVDAIDPSLAIREGRAMQIIMDSMGDLRIQGPRRKMHGSLLVRMLRWLLELASSFASVASVA